MNDNRYFENAHMLLAELELVISEVNRQWPKSLSESVKEDETTKAHWRLARKRDLLSDSVKVFSAMSVEAFLNFYGVLRLGSRQFDRKLELLGPVAKLKKLFELCDNITLTDNDAIVQVLDRIAKLRNRQVHPVAVKVSGYLPAEERGGDKIPEVAKEAVADMILFFQEFGKCQPNVAHHLPKPYTTDA
ncbi:MAG: hypothetical protein KJ692_00280 [Verrucomicrobia bacterium]|nr:hypothetical protein [Verrucomicrobiota bacterium]